MTCLWATLEWTSKRDGQRRTTTESPVPKWQCPSQTLGAWLAAASPTGFWEHMHDTTHSTQQHFSQSDLPHVLPFWNPLYRLYIRLTSLENSICLNSIIYIYIYIHIYIYVYEYTFLFSFCVIWHQWCLSYRTKILISLKSLYSHLFYFCFAVLRCVTSMYSGAQRLQWKSCVSSSLSHLHTTSSELQYVILPFFPAAKNGLVFCLEC